MNNRSEQELRQSIEASRARLADTVEEIGARVNPDRVQRELKARARDEVDEFKANVKRKARSTMRDLEHEAEDRGRGMLRAIKDNPVPATLVGVGLAWMVANSARTDRDSSTARVDVYGRTRPFPTGYPPQYGYGYDIEPEYEAQAGYGAAPGPSRPVARTHAEIHVEGGSSDEGSGARERAEELADEARERGEEMKEKVQDRAHEAMDAARERTSEMADRGREQARNARYRAQEWTDEVQHRAVRAEHRVEDAVRENPLAAGAMAAALGFAAGLMVPETQREHEMLGRHRDRALHKAKKSAVKAAGKAKETARETAGDAARRAVDSAFEAGGAGGAEQENAMTEPGRR